MEAISTTARVLALAVETCFVRIDMFTATHLHTSNVMHYLLYILVRFISPLVSSPYDVCKSPGLCVEMMGGSGVGIFVAEGFASLRLLPSFLLWLTTSIRPVAQTVCFASIIHWRLMQLTSVRPGDAGHGCWSRTPSCESYVTRDWSISESAWVIMRSFCQNQMFRSKSSL